MENLLPLIIQLVSGAAGGNAAGAMMKNLSLGTVGNSLVGILGGGLGGQLLGMFGMAAGGSDVGAAGLDLASVLGSVASGGVGGGVLMAVVGMVKKALGK